MVRPAGLSSLGFGRGANDMTSENLLLRKRQTGTYGEISWKRPRPTHCCSASKQDALFHCVIMYLHNERENSWKIEVINTML
jgi:hypothetical protein